MKLVKINKTHSYILFFINLLRRNENRYIKNKN